MKTTPIPTLLRIDASARADGSYSRQLADTIETLWRAQHPQGRVKLRDLGAQPLPHIDALTIQGFYTPVAAMTPALREATALSDSLIEELKSAHTVLIATPIYNFSVPSGLKAWIDQVVRIGQTFSYVDGAFAGLVTQPRAVLALAYGAGGYQADMAAMDHLRPYLTSLLTFMGMADIQVVACEATTADPATVEANLGTAQRQAAALFAPEMARG